MDLPNGAYTGDWYMTDGNGNPLYNNQGQALTKPSTFWPDHWSNADIEAAIAEAWHHARMPGNDGVSTQGFAGVGGGHWVQVWLRDGKVITAYPNYGPWGL